MKYKNSLYLQIASRDIKLKTFNHANICVDPEKHQQMLYSDVRLKNLIFTAQNAPLRYR